MHNMDIHFKKLAGALRRLAGLVTEGKAIRLETQGRIDASVQVPAQHIGLAVRPI